MSLALALLASSLVAPDIGQKQAFWLLGRYNSGNPAPQGAAAEVFLTLSPEGKVSACRTGELIGERVSAQKVCRIVMGMPVDPATVDGKPVWGAIHTLIASFQPGEQKGRKVAATALAPELALVVNTLPNGADQPLEVVVYTMISPEGRITECMGRDGQNAKYAEVACTQLSGATHDIVKTSTGEPVTYVRSFRASFSKQETPK